MKKKAFTLVELMAVVAIIAILAVVLVPTVSGYINRAKKVTIVSQARIAVSAFNYFNATSTSKKVGSNPDCLVGYNVAVVINDPEIITIEEVNKIDNMKVSDAFLINKDDDAIKKIEIDSAGKFVSYTP